MRQDLHDAFREKHRESDGFRVNEHGYAKVKDGVRNWLWGDKETRAQSYTRGYQCYRDKLNAEIPIIVDGKPLGQAVLERIARNNDGFFGPLDKQMLHLFDAELKQVLDEELQRGLSDPSKHAEVQEISKLLGDAIQQDRNPVAVNRLRAWRHVVADKNLLAGALHEEASRALVSAFPELQNDPARVSQEVNQLLGEVFNEIGDDIHAGLCAQNMGAAKSLMRAKLTNLGVPAETAKRHVTLAACGQRMDARQKFSHFKKQAGDANIALGWFAQEHKGDPQLGHLNNGMRQITHQTNGFMKDFEQYLDHGDQHDFNSVWTQSRQCMANLTFMAKQLTRMKDNPQAVHMGQNMMVQAARIHDMMSSAMHPSKRVDPTHANLLPAIPAVLVGASHLHTYDPRFIATPVNVDGISLKQKRSGARNEDVVNARLRDFQTTMRNYNARLARVSTKLQALQVDTGFDRRARVQEARQRNDPELRRAANKPLQELAKEIDKALISNDYALQQHRLTTGRRSGKNYGLTWTKNWTSDRDANPGKVETQLIAQRRELQQMKLEVARVVAQRQNSFGMIDDRALNPRDAAARQESVQLFQEEMMQAPAGGAMAPVQNMGGGGVLQFPVYPVQQPMPAQDIVVPVPLQDDVMAHPDMVQEEEAEDDNAAMNPSDVHYDDEGDQNDNYDAANDEIPLDEVEVDYVTPMGDDDHDNGSNASFEIGGDDDLDDDVWGMGADEFPVAGSEQNYGQEETIGQLQQNALNDPGGVTPGLDTPAGPTPGGNLAPPVFKHDDMYENDSNASDDLDLTRFDNQLDEVDDPENDDNDDDPQIAMPETPDDDIYGQRRVEDGDTPAGADEKQ
ncbi:MAG: hypothetical protein AAF416_16865 [Pseudomonadota bacterium]